MERERQRDRERERERERGKERETEREKEKWHNVKVNLKRNTDWVIPKQTTELYFS